MGRKLGDLSAQWESNGDPGSISPPESAWEDGGGISYGAYQFASKHEVPKEFIRFAQRKGYKHADALAVAGEPGSDQFSNEWTRVARLDPEGFYDMQHQFTQEQYYDAAVREMRALGIDPDQRSDALRQVIWSRKVQYNDNFPELIVTAAAKAGQPLSSINDADLIRNIYEVTLTDPGWIDEDSPYRESLHDRFRGERDTALKWLDEEQRPPAGFGNTLREWEKREQTRLSQLLDEEQRPLTGFGNTLREWEKREQTRLSQLLED